MWKETPKAKEQEKANWVSENIVEMAQKKRKATSKNNKDLRKE